MSKAVLYFKLIALIVLQLCTSPVLASSPYDVLEIEPTADLTVATRAYRTLAMKYHPDRNPSPEATEKLKEINVAYGKIKKAAERGEILEDREIKETVLSSEELNQKIAELLSLNDPSQELKILSLLKKYVTSGERWEKQVTIFESSASFIEDLLSRYNDKVMSRPFAQQMVSVFHEAAMPMHHFADSADFYDQRDLFLNLEARFILRFALQNDVSTRELVDILPRANGGPPDSSISTFGYRFLADVAMLRGEISDMKSYEAFENEMRRIRGFAQQDPFLTDLHLFPAVAERLFESVDSFEKLDFISSRLGLSGATLEVKRRLMEVAIEKRLVSDSEQFVKVLRNLVGDNPTHPHQSLRIQLVSEFRKTNSPAALWNSYFYIGEVTRWNKAIPLTQRLWLKNAPIALLKPFIAAGPLKMIDPLVAHTQLKKMSEKRFTSSVIAAPSCKFVYRH